MFRFSSRIYTSLRPKIQVCRRVGSQHQLVRTRVCERFTAITSSPPSRCYSTPHVTPAEDRVIVGNHGLKPTAVVKNGRMLEVTLKGERLRYPLVWLRDVCTCRFCHEPSSGGRLLLLTDLDPDVDTNEVQIDADSGDTVITWCDGHVSRYEAAWLWEKRFTESAARERNVNLRLPYKTWGSELQGAIPTGSYTDLIKNDGFLYEWLVAMEETGLFLLKDAPKTVGVIGEIGKRVAYNRNTCYGQEFHVRSKTNPTDLAFTTNALSLHCDLPYYHHMPGIQMLHCISQVPSIGGENQFSDAFRAVEILQEESPEDFDILTKHSLEYVDMGSDYIRYNLVARRPCIGIGRDGSLRSVCIDDQKRGYFTNHLPVDVIQPLYSAMSKLFDIMYDNRNLIQYKLEEGDVICFHNDRVFHARSAFQVTEGGERFLTGGYIDWDEMRSMRRVLKDHLRAD